MTSRYTQNVTFKLAGFPKPFLATVTNCHCKGMGKETNDSGRSRCIDLFECEKELRIM